jgi:hypothetical protein
MAVKQSGASDVEGDGGLHHVVRDGRFGKPRPRLHGAIGKE